VDQDWDAYSGDDHDLWRRLYRRQASLVAGHACDEFIAALGRVRFRRCDPALRRHQPQAGPATRWQLVAVPGLVPDLTFFEHLANRRFPVTVWIRKPEEFDYIVEPDIFHDFFGHVPMLFNPVFADYIQAYGRGGIKAHALGAIEMLARLYWYTVEFGSSTRRRGLRPTGRDPLLGRRDRLLPGKPEPQPHRLRPAAHHADALQDRHLPGDVLRDPRLPAALRRHGAGLHAVLRALRGREPHAPRRCWRPIACTTGASRRRAPA
jgi:phenylalanine-4-hydroxylase